MTLPILIGLYSPLPRSGKSTVAAHLTNFHKFQRRPFATPLKQMAYILLENLGIMPVMAQTMLEHNKDRKVYGDVTVRKILQTLGTDWGRNMIGPNLWTDLWRFKVKNLLKSGIAIVADDMRFPNEAEIVRSLGGKLWKVVRPDAPPLEGDHQSEGRLNAIEFDRTITNDKTIEDLYKEIDNV